MGDLDSTRTVLRDNGRRRNRTNLDVLIQNDPAFIHLEELVKHFGNEDPIGRELYIRMLPCLQARCRKVGEKIYVRKDAADAMIGAYNNIRKKWGEKIPESYEERFTQYREEVEKVFEAIRTQGI